MKAKKFRPQSYSKKYSLKENRRGQYTGKYNWQSFNRAPDDHCWLLKFFGILHYNISHAPERVSCRWKQAGLRWEQRSAKNASFRYSNSISFERLW